MPDWLIERGIGEDRLLLVENDRVIAARLAWPDELSAGQSLNAKLVSRRGGSARGTARTDAGIELLVDRLPRDASEGSSLDLVVTRGAVAERGRLKRAQARVGTGSPGSIASDGARQVRRFPAGLWEDVWSAAFEGTLPFPGGSLLFDLTPGMTVIDIDGDLPPRELCLAAVPAIARGLRWFDLGGSIAIDFPTLGAKADRQAVDHAIGEALAGWPHERTAMNGFGLVQIVARLTGPSLLHRLRHRRPSAAARFLLRQAESLDGAGAVQLTGHPAELAAIESGWIAELEQRSGREVRVRADAAVAIGGGHAQIVPR